MFNIFLQFYLSSFRGKEYFAKEPEPEPVRAGCFLPLGAGAAQKKIPGAGAGAAWEKNQKPEPELLAKKSQEPEPDPGRLPSPATDLGQKGSVPSKKVSVPGISAEWSQELFPEHWGNLGDDHLVNLNSLLMTLKLK